MARNFVAASVEFLRGAAVVTAAPFTVSIWARCSDDVADDHAVWFTGRSNSNENFWGLRFNDTASGHTIRYRVTDGLATNLETVATWTLNQWHHLCAVEAASNDRRLYLDGGNKVTDANSRSPDGGINRTSIGRFDDNTPGVEMEGDIAHVAVWNVALTDGEVATLAEGVSPLRVRRDSLIAYWPVGGQSPEADVVGGLNMIVTGTTVSEEPPIPHAVVAPG